MPRLRQEQALQGESGKRPGCQGGQEAARAHRRQFYIHSGQDHLEGTRQTRLLDLDTVLREVNRCITEAYLLAKVHVVRLCSAGIPLYDLDQTFFHRCLSAVSVSSRKKPEVDDFELLVSIKLYRSWRPEGYVPPVSTHLATGFQQQASQQTATNMRNSTVANFYRRFKKELKLRYSLDSKQAYEALQSIRAAEDKGEDPLVKRYRDLLPPKPEKGRLEDNPGLVMPLQHLFLRTFEAAQLEKQTDRPPRLFSLVPKEQGYECSHIKICANGLYSLLKSHEVKHLPKNADAFRPVADTYWRRFFYISKFETANRRFAGEILTDGKVVSIVLRRPKAEACTPGAPIDPDAYGEVWGLDSGRREMFVASNDAQHAQRVTTWPCSSTTPDHKLTGLRTSRRDRGKPELSCTDSVGERGAPPPCREKHRRTAGPQSLPSAKRILDHDRSAYIGPIYYRIQRAAQISRHCSRLSEA